MVYFLRCVELRTTPNEHLFAHMRAVFEGTLESGGGKAAKAPPVPVHGSRRKKALVREERRSSVSPVAGGCGGDGGEEVEEEMPGRDGPGVAVEEKGGEGDCAQLEGGWEEGESEEGAAASGVESEEAEEEEEDEDEDEEEEEEGGEDGDDEGLSDAVALYSSPKMVCSGLLSPHTSLLLNPPALLVRTAW